MNKISYKTYLNDRLKQVDFHGQLTCPLYVQVTFERKTIFFKSYYFELFSKSRYGLELPDSVLKKVYDENALKVIPGIDKSLFGVSPSQ